MVRAILQSLFVRPAPSVGARSAGCGPILYRRWDVAGPLTAPEAYDLVERLAISRDPGCVLSRVERRHGADQEGRSTSWRLSFRLPDTGMRAIYDVICLVDETDGSIRDGVEIEECVELDHARLLKRAA